MKVQTKNNLVGFVWQKTPVMSQYILSRGHNGNQTFEQWCKDSIENYRKRYDELFQETENDIKQLEKLGCSKIIVAPEPVGQTRISLFKGLISELPENIFLVVQSFAGFGNATTLHYCMDLALQKNIFLISEEHLSLMLVPEQVLNELYLNWPRKYMSPVPRCRKHETLKQQALELVAKGMNHTNAQRELGVSRSTFYRMLADGKKASN
jgi:DNA-directed RNA polymerase subunit N (RpoN/RPB10)